MLRLNPRVAGVEVGYAESVAVQALTTTMTEVPGLSITFTADGVSTYEISMNAYGNKATNAGDMSVAIYDNGTLIVARSVTLTATGAAGFHAVRRLIPSAGVHTYTGRARVTTAGGQLTADTTFVGPLFVSAVRL